MKRLIEKYDSQFLKDDGTRGYCRLVTIPFNEIPVDLDFTGYDIQITNLLYDNKYDENHHITCRIKVKNFDENQNAIWIEIPKWIQDILFSAYSQGIRRVITGLEKMEYENNAIKKMEPIPYSNTVGM